MAFAGGLIDVSEATETGELSLNSRLCMSQIFSGCDFG
jgi:hypothetical protein